MGADVPFCHFLLRVAMNNTEKKIIAIDAMSGDKGPRAVFGGINQYLYQNGEDKVFFRVFGAARALRKLLAKYPRVARNCEIIDAPDIIRGTDKSREVLRHAQNTSMYMAIKDVREGNSAAVVSAGNTGVLMSLSKLALKTIDGISRPAITTMLPSGAGDARVERRVRGRDSADPFDHRLTKACAPRIELRRLADGAPGVVCGGVKVEQRVVRRAP